jgi:predicted O-methyltransferase YrrM
MENWKQVDGWFNEENEIFFEDCISKLNNPKIFYEVGTWKGRSTCCMAQLIKRKNINAKLYGIDTFLGSDEDIHRSEINILKSSNLTLLDVFKSNIKNCDVEDIIIPIVSTGTEASKNVKDNSLDFIYLDASHDYESVKEDIETWLPKMKKGSIISGDDYVVCWPGVIRAVNEVFSKMNKNVDIGGYVNNDNPVGTQWRVFL